MPELDPNRTFSQEEEEDNDYLLTENELEEGVEARALTCKNAQDSNRFWMCDVNTGRGFKASVTAPVDAVNIMPSEETEIKKTRVTRTNNRMITNVQVAQRGGSETGENLEVTGTCRPSSTTDRGTFCELKVEDA